MIQPSVLPSDYRLWLENVKTTIRSAQIKAAFSVNEKMIRMHWDLGRMIDDKIQNAHCCYH